jgi:glycine/D-amino acid oxidase-like deaminating enzyme/nitrite reductase/ring-hydroxylating ferredoxin subunit
MLSSVAGDGRADEMATEGKTGSPKHQPVWEATAKLPQFGPLQESLEADVCIVGAGISGLSTAYFLTQEGLSVVVLDEGEVAGGMTGVTTAHLTHALDDRYFEIERLHGAEGARRAAESHTAAIDRIEAVVKKEKISCSFSRLDGYLFLAPGEKEEVLDRELEAARRAGLAEVSKLDRLPLRSISPGPCLRFPNQGQFHPLKYLAGVARAIERDGGRIFTHSRAEAIEGGSPARVTCGRRHVTSRAVVVATNSPVNDRMVLHTKQAPYMTYVIAGRVPHGSVPHALYWDTLDPYHYVRFLEGTGTAKGKSDVLIVGGEDHKTGQADDADERYARLEAWARERFPKLARIERTWAGQVMETIDGLAFLGRNPWDEDNVFVATGDSGMGMTHGTIAGILLTDLIVGRENPWATLYDPSRKPLRAAKDFLSENLNVAAQYADWLTGGDTGSEDEIAPDSGAVLRRGLAKVALYRDQKGKLHERSAVCPHLGCVVQWNSNDKTWDCPCHGSRFDKLGKVINGPANRDLGET